MSNIVFLNLKSKNVTNVLHLACFFTHFMKDHASFHERMIVKNTCKIFGRISGMMDIKHGHPKVTPYGGKTLYYQCQQYCSLSH